METGKACELITFIEQSPSVYHVIDNARRRLIEAGFIELEPSEPFLLSAGGRYFITANGSSLIAWQMSSAAAKGFKLIGSHSDSPCLRIKPRPEIGVHDHYLKLNTEVYGGPLLSTWFDRPLSCAGRAVIRSADPLAPHEVLTAFDNYPLIIPSLAIHMNREVNDGYKIDRQKDLLPVFGLINNTFEKDGFLVRLLARQLNVSEHDILDFDLYLYDPQPGCLCGLSNEFFSVGRIDNLGMAYASLDALISEQAPLEDYVKAVCIFDNEEVGSGTMQGAGSPFLADTLKRITASQCAPAGNWFELFQQQMSRSFLISADQAHALHPNYPEKNDITNFPLINEGPVIKIAASMSYTSDGVSAGIFKDLCTRAGVPCQTFVNRSDMRGGSTIGPITAGNLRIKAVDIGNPILAMHSIRELGGVADQAYITRVFRRYYSE
ncbi:MAG: M18 family aminopeptidase [Treponema sp.]